MRSASPSAAGCRTFEENVVAPLQNRDPTGLSQLLPAGGGFRFYSVTDSEPHRTAETYRLDVTGLVDQPMTLTLADLQAMKQTSPGTGLPVRDRVAGARGALVRRALSDLLDEVGVKPAAKALTFTSFDGTYTDSLTLDQARRPDVLVATQMLGKPVTQRPRRSGTALRRADVRLQVGQVARRDRARRRRRARASGRTNGYDIDAWVGKSNGRDDAATS